MAYNTYTYMLLFLTGTGFLYYILPKKVRWVVLLAASYLFYYLSSAKLMGFLMLSTVVVYGTGMILTILQDEYQDKMADAGQEEQMVLRQQLQKKKRLAAACAILFNLGILVFLKYYNFFALNVNHILQGLHIDGRITELRLLLPLGISFYTLSAIGYIIDVYRGKYRADKNLGHLALFLSFFGQIVEGPIGRYDQMSDELLSGHSFQPKNISFGVQRIVWGLFKKIVIADRLNLLVNTVFTAYPDYTGITIATAVLCYTIQIYCEFSGCMDMVIGSAQLFGVRLPENFERPFFSKNVSEFWRRWHITLGAWFRDYIFYPVSLSKRVMRLGKWGRNHLAPHLAKLLPSVCALFPVWLCNGFWHGSSWKYVFYGMYYFMIIILGMLAEPLFQKLCNFLHLNRKSWGFQCWQILRTFFLVNIGMLFFRAASLKVGIKMLFSMFGGFSLAPLREGVLLNLGMDKMDYAAVGFGILVVFAVSIAQEKGVHIREWIARRHIAVRFAIYYAAAFSVLLLGAYGMGYVPVDFIYAQF